MAIKFTDLQGKASKSGPERYKPVNGENRFRIVGSVLPSYKYWLNTRDGTVVPLECLSFDPSEEKFDNRKPDPVRKYFPEQKCSWAYQSFVIDRNDGKVKLFDHKKKLFESILDAAKKKMGDPTDPENGWDVVFTRTKTGPRAYNVEYRLETFELENSPLSDEDKAAVEEAGRIEDVVFRQSVEDQERFIKDYILEEENADEEAAEELDRHMEDDIPFDAD
jgi:hypothetical protein